jgi:hypothetical protein
MAKSSKKRRAVSKRKAVKGKAMKKNAAKKEAAKKEAAKKEAAKKEAAKKVTRAPRPSTTVERPSPEEEAAFTRALIESGEAARLDEECKLPAGATHKLVEDEAGHLKAVRRRFSISG